MDRQGSARGEFAAYLSGKQTVRAERAFWIGEALRELGFAWCSGPVALYGAKLLTDFVSVVANMDQAGHTSYAAMFATLSPLLTLDEFAIDEFAIDAEGRKQGRPPWWPSPQELRERDELKSRARKYLANRNAIDEEAKWRKAFRRESERGWNDDLAALVEFARSDADRSLIERTLWRELLDWGLANVDDDALFKLVVAEIDAYEKHQRRLSIKRKAEIKRFRRLIMSASVETSRA